MEKYERKKNSIGATNKRKGSDAERFYATLFQELGFSYCITARLGGRLYDNAGIDLMNIPYNIQVKGGNHKNLSPGQSLFNMHNQINSLFPETSEVRDYPIILIHRPFIYKKDTGDDVVYYTLEQHKRFQEDIKNPHFEYSSIKVRKIMINSEFGKIVKVPFDSFKENVLLYKNNKNDLQNIEK